MRYLTICVLSAFFTATFLQAEQSLTLGLGGIAKVEPYSGSKNKALILPYIDARYNGFYIKGLEGGFEQRIGDVSATLMIRGRLDGYKSSDSDQLSGMEERKYALDGGIKLAYQYKNIGSFSIGALTDISGVHKGHEFSTEYSRAHFFDKSTLIPFVSIRLQDKKLASYYYGVKENETLPNRAAYLPSSALNCEIGARYIYAIDQKSSVVAIISYTALDDKITKSPIVDKNGIAKAAIFYGYKF